MHKMNAFYVGHVYLSFHTYNFWNDSNDFR